ncbi:MAG TPA: flagellar FlbD family protein [Acidimicrobiales bacterium]|nr:flagellar FlbD family protein [Acidimicrobiales bacterium]
MIYLARFHGGERIAINPDLIERIEETPDTVITLTSGAKHVVGESMDEVIERFRAFRASTLALAVRMAEPSEVACVTHLRVLRGGADSRTGAKDTCDQGTHEPRGAER